jgi:amino acid adenylation domain-containing protein
MYTFFGILGSSRGPRGFFPHATSSKLGVFVQRALWFGFLRSSEKFADRPALFAEGKFLKYSELRAEACRVAATIQAHVDPSETTLTAVFAYRSPTAFIGVLGSLLAGNGYVPLNRTFPIERTQVMLERSGCGSIIVDEGSLPQLNKLLETVSSPLLVLTPDALDFTSYKQQWPQHTFLAGHELKPADNWQERAFELDSIAYLLFTSGSTGIPKGVAVAQRNVTAFLDYMVERYQITEFDRLSQMFDMTFDLSVFDMFVAWERGACVFCPSQKTLIKPGKFIKDSELTIWFSVPSTAVFMKQLGMLKPAQYPSLRLSLFCGEPLPVSSATAWLEAAPNSTLENLYGPTELTIACTLYRWHPSRSLAESELGIVPIGYPYPNMGVLVVDDNLLEVSPGQEGELLMNGPQMSLGYWKDPVKTAAAFLVPPGKNEIYYRTGDRVRRPLGNAPLTHLGRIDSQVKIFGHRVELGEVESRVRDACGCDGVVAVGWPKTDSGFGGVEVFIEGRESDKEKLRSAVAKDLPEYMVPRRFHFMDRLPRNANNKYDRKAMQKLLEEGL